MQVKNKLNEGFNNSTKSEQATNTTNLDSRLAAVTEKVREIVKHLDYHITTDKKDGRWCPYCFTIFGKRGRE